ncbi:Putative nucleotide-binding of sugar-metabolising enzyme [Paenibacillus sp. 1_12]|uniref:nucleotide-binding domain containing protein n=1 Tax=Paenibacillus sp. 1_12 TaxID=1566278 RepID=UPI0008E4CE54|nr:nucleotide-binding domain containing protein [Paenibacillus sp. 1_12]SFL60376.1 Putative nucleotide-binding of sugar-metabolising enzyme [Paenibacillus sp. 1_12]
MECEAQEALKQGKSVILYSAAGPNDDSIANIREALMEQGLKAEDSGRLLGSALGVLTQRLIAEQGLSRILIAGGDTSGYITRELGIYALECRAALDPGAPLCRAYSHDPLFDGLERGSSVYIYSSHITIKSSLYSNNCKLENLRDCRLSRANVSEPHIC